MGCSARSSRMCSNPCQSQTQFRFPTSSTFHRSRLVSAWSRSHRSFQILSRSLCQRRSPCTSHHHRHLALLHTPSTQAIREQLEQLEPPTAVHMLESQTSDMEEPTEE